MKFCITCKHYENEKCCRNKREYQSLETSRMLTTGELSPTDERHHGRFLAVIYDTCGQAGRYWELKNG